MANKDSRFPQMQLQFMTKFQELLTINFKHEYFADGNCPVLDVQPTESTMQELKRLQIQFRKTDFGVNLGYASMDQYTPLKELKKPINLSFIINVTDTCFLNYTDLPYEFNDGELFYFNNRDLEKDSTEHKNLSIDEFVTDEDKIEISGAFFRHDFDEAQFDAEVQLVNSVEEVVYEEHIDDGRDYCELIISDQAPGKYTLLVDGLEERSFYLYNGIKRIFGVMDVTIDPEDDSDYSFFKEGEIQAQEYKVHFQNRAVRWKYLVVEKGEKKLHQNHKIYDSNKANNHEKMNFEEVQEEVLDNGEIVQAIWSETPIAFRQNYTQKFKLKTQKGKNKLEWLVDLPIASAKSDLKANFLGEDAFFSELIVYL